jgi:hypothetical protein
MKWPIESKQIFVDKIPIAIASRKDTVTSRDPHEVKAVTPPRRNGVLYADNHTSHHVKKSIS